VAAYVGFVAGIKGKDQGPLADAGQPKTSKKPAVAKAGKLTIPAIDGTAFAFSLAQAPAGQITVDMPNKSPIQHNIELKGVSGAAGKVVGQGATSTFSVDLKPGKYTYFCPVGDHRAAGMEGTLTVS
jgi:plastocyanin